MIIDCLYKLPPPSQQIMQLREVKIEQCKLILGDKYLLAKPILKKETK